MGAIQRAIFSRAFRIYSVILMLVNTDCDQQEGILWVLRYLPRYSLEMPLSNLYVHYGKTPTIQTAEASAKLRVYFRAK